MRSTATKLSSANLDYATLLSGVELRPPCFERGRGVLHSGEYVERGPLMALSTCGNWNFKTTPQPRGNALEKRSVRKRWWFGQSLDCYRMILLVPSIVLALLVLAWIAWIALEPRSSATPTAHPSANTLHGGSGLGVPGQNDFDDGSETDFQRHIRNRIEEVQLPMGTVAGATLPDGGRMPQRIADPSGGPKD